jgi:hypothetical protein
MERARATWTDERLDDLSRRVDSGFNRIDGDLRQLRTEMSADLNGLRVEMNRRFDALQRLMIQTSGGMLIVVVGTLVSVLVTRS